MGKKTRKCYYKKSSSSSCHKCSSCSPSSDKSHKKGKCCCSSSCSSSAYTVDECRKAVAKGNYRPRKCSCSSSSSSDEDSLCRSTSATCNPCRYDISQKDCPSSSSSSCCSDSSCCSSSSDCYSSSSSSSCSSSSESKCDPYYLRNEKPIKVTICKNGNKCQVYRWKYGRSRCRHNKLYGECPYNCPVVCCTKQYGGKKYKYNDYHAALEGKYDKKLGKNYCHKKSSSSSISECPGGCPPKCKKHWKEDNWEGKGKQMGKWEGKVKWENQGKKK